MGRSCVGSGDVVCVVGAWDDCGVMWDWGLLWGPGLFLCVGDPGMVMVLAPTPGVAVVLFNQSETLSGG